MMPTSLEDPSAAGRPQPAATGLGFGAILLWSTLAGLTILKGPALPPFQTTAITFAVGGLLLVVVAILRQRAAALRPHLWPFALAVSGLFTFHALYFAALRLAPPAEASLIASLWALLTVLLAAFSPGHGWHKRHVMGALLGLAASVLLVVGKGPLDLDVRHLSGFGLAFGCAFVWASYSVLCRLFAKEPSEGLALPCLVTAALALICNLIFEQWVWPIGQQTWLALVLLGLGPTGGAFLLWDIGMKHGDVSRLGVLAYASPVLSTALLIALGLASASAAVVAACVLMTAAAALSNFGGARNA